MESGGRGALVSAEERRALVLLRLLPGVGDRRLSRLLGTAGSARRALALTSGQFVKTLGVKAEAARRDPGIRQQADWVLERCEALQIEILPLGSLLYPAGLMGLVDPPPVLFLRGDRSLLSRRSIAIVGSRRATGVGRRTAERISRELSQSGVTVVSGLALGIDGAAHRGALGDPGGTIAVLGSGPDRPYPASNCHLFHEILDQGLLVSEFPSGEPARRSGALITVDHALDLGLEVFAVPGSVEMTQAEGTNALIRDGAHLLTRGSEALDVLGWQPSDNRLEGGDPAGHPGLRLAQQSGSPSASDSDLGRVRAAFGPGPLVLDQLVPEVGLPVPRILAALTRLELNGSIARAGEGWSLTRPRR